MISVEAVRKSANLWPSRKLAQNRHAIGRAVCASVALIFFSAGICKADSLFVGFNGLTPVQIYSESGTYTQDLGPAGALAAIPTSSSYFFVEPSADFTTSTIAQYNASLTQTGSFTVNDLIDDGAPGTGSSLWLASYNGTVYRVSDTGAVNTSWSTGYTHTGVAFDGTYVYTTEGDSGSNIDKWTTAGAFVGQIATPYTGLYGLGYDSSTGDFWAGSTDFVYEFNTSGNVLATLDLTGDSRTPDGAVHDSVTVGNLLAPVTTTIPEPNLGLLCGIGLVLLFGVIAVRRKAFSLRRQAAVPVTLAILALSSAATVFGSVNVTLSPSANDVQVGTTVVWTASAVDTSNASAKFSYQFSVALSGSPLQVRRDFSSVNTFPWTPVDQDGTYTVGVTVKSSTGASSSAQASYAVSSRVTGSTPEISATSNPLVALYSVPPCTAGRTARVRFKTASETVWAATSYKTCTGNSSLNFYVAGMRPSTAYTMQQDVFNGPFDTMGPLLTFTTGAIPAGAGIISSNIAHPAATPNATAYPVVLTAPIFPGPPFATDTQGNVIWYLPSFQKANDGYITRPVIGGTILGVYDDAAPPAGNRRLAVEWDLAGNVVRETNAAAISAQLVSFGTDPITSISHEVFRFPNGDTGIMGTVEKVADQGAGPVDVLGDMAIVLDSNLQVKWWWNEFEHLNIKRTAILGEVCAQGNPGCPPLYTPGYSSANDWTHSNSLAPTPDGDLVISIRHQDWVIKLNYQNGSVPAWRKGQPDNTIVWTLGKGGNFTLNSSGVWFSHQHDVTFAANGYLTMFDNGNTTGGDSRGQAWQLDQKNFIATPVENQDLGVMSIATGSAELLSNGNYFFYCGYITSYSKSVEYTPGGALQFEQDFPSNVGYRSFRMRSLYSEY